MYNPHSVTVDAGVLALPSTDCTREDIFTYVDTILEWKKLLDESWIKIYMSERATYSLSKDRSFPMRDKLKKLFKSHAIETYDFNTVSIITTRLLSITPSLESHFRVEDILTDNLEICPDVICLATHDGLQSDLERCIMLIAVLRKHCSHLHGNHSLILREAPDREIRVRAQIYEIDHTRDDIPALPCPPDFFEGSVSVCDNFCDLIECLDESAMLVDSSDDCKIAFAIRIAVFKYDIKQGESPDWSQVYAPTIGANFRKSCQKACTDNGRSMPSMVFRSIIETIKGLNLQAVHALRTGLAGNDPQRMRGSDKAYRRDIDNKLHLHYWKCGDGTIELASVVYHDDFSIPG